MGKPLLPFSASELNREMKKWEVLPEDLRFAEEHDTKTHYTSYSLKRGAVEHLAQQAAMKKLDPKLIPVVAKHKDQQSLMPSTTMRYTTKEPLLRALGVAKATALL